MLLRRYHESPEPDTNPETVTELGTEPVDPDTNPETVTELPPGAGSTKK